MHKRKTTVLAAVLAAALVGLLAAALAMAQPGLASEARAAQSTPTASPAASEESDSEPAAWLTIDAAEGLRLDPFLVSVQGGGPALASALDENCTGFVADAPTASVNYQGDADRLTAFVYSDGDSTLVVRTPDGDFLCGDNTNPLILDPTITITAPVTGTYDVWVGSAVATDLIPGFLVFTGRGDLDATQMALASLVKRPPAPQVLPLRDRLVRAAQRLEEVSAKLEDVPELEAGGDDVEVDFTADGELPAPELLTGGDLCSGLVSLAPTYAFRWTGEAEALNLFVEADGDTTLLVRTPGGEALCADDADGVNNLNPLLTIDAPAEGLYLVWVGRIDPDSPVTGVLTLTESADAGPEALGQP